ncbi:MAG: hypothetical protein HYX99_02020 [Chloroflexi bacterium]|nr:hypothetical protein [Chloroflexota bacterium]
MAGLVAIVALAPFMVARALYTTARTPWLLKAGLAGVLVGLSWLVFVASLRRYRLGHRKPG